MEILAGATFGLAALGYFLYRRKTDQDDDETTTIRSPLPSSSSDASPFSPAFFRVDLSQLAAVYHHNHGHIPFVKACILRLSQADALSTPGIFRESGSRQRVEELIVRFSQPDCSSFEDISAVLSNEEVKTVSSLLQYWLTEMPESFVSVESYAALHQIAAGKTKFNQSACTQEVLTWLGRLPEVSQYFFREFLPLLSQIVAHSDVNRMTLHNLATVTSPLLLLCMNPATILSETALNAKIFEVLISEWHHLSF